jgi:hypothetical protein
MKPWTKLSRGKWAEARAEEWLEGMAHQRAFTWHRYPDTRSARAIIAAQPADYEFVYAGTPFKLEVKESGEKHRLPKAAVGQWPVLRRFWMAGTCVLVLVYRTGLDCWLVLGDSTLFPEGDPPKSWAFEGHRTFATAHEALAHHTMAFA